MSDSEQLAPWLMQYDLLFCRHDSAQNQPGGRLGRWQQWTKAYMHAGVTTSMNQYSIIIIVSINQETIRDIITNTPRLTVGKLVSVGISYTKTTRPTILDLLDLINRLNSSYKCQIMMIMMIISITIFSYAVYRMTFHSFVVTNTNKPKFMMHCLQLSECMILHPSL